MTKILLFLSLLVPVFAQAQSVELNKVLSVATVDFNGDGGFDRAVLVESEDAGTSDLYLYLSKFDKPTYKYSMELKLVKKDAAFFGGMWGQTPSLEPMSGAVKITSLNEAVGRGRWVLSLIVKYKDNEFLVTGLTYSVRDTLDLDAGGNCEVDFVTGELKRNGQPFATVKRYIRLSDWKDSSLPEACKF